MAREGTEPDSRRLRLGWVASPTSGRLRGRFGPPAGGPAAPSRSSYGRGLYRPLLRAIRHCRGDRPGRRLLHVTNAGGDARRSSFFTPAGRPHASCVGDALLAHGRPLAPVLSAALSAHGAPAGWSRVADRAGALRRWRLRSSLPSRIAVAGRRAEASRGGLRIDYRATASRLRHIIAVPGTPPRHS